MYAKLCSDPGHVPGFLRQGGAIQPVELRIGIGGLTCNRPTSPQSRQRNRRGRRSEPFPCLTHSPSGSTRHTSQRGQ